jgi:hypothetical protein
MTYCRLASGQLLAPWISWLPEHRPFLLVLLMLLVLVLVLVLLVLALALVEPAAGAAAGMSSSAMGWQEAADRGCLCSGRRRSGTGSAVSTMATSHQSTQ